MPENMDEAMVFRRTICPCAANVGRLGQRRSRRYGRLENRLNDQLNDQHPDVFDCLRYLGGLQGTVDVQIHEVTPVRNHMCMTEAI
jgi:hypothetical protein